MEKPILFNTDMVRAILDGRKTVTRRLVKHDVSAILNSQYHKEHPEVSDNSLIEKLCQSPYETGQFIYVRETWSEHKRTEKYYYRADSLCDGHSTEWECPERAEKTDNCELCEQVDGYIKWHPSIHMPKVAARIWLKVTDVRVERLRNISIQDMLSEGIDQTGIITATGAIEYRVINRFEELWNSTIKKSALDIYGFEASPWVWVIEFERCDKPEQDGAE